MCVCEQCVMIIIFQRAFGPRAMHSQLPSHMSHEHMLSSGKRNVGRRKYQNTRSGTTMACAYCRLASWHRRRANFGRFQARRQQQRCRCVILCRQNAATTTAERNDDNVDDDNAVGMNDDEDGKTCGGSRLLIWKS